MRVLIFFVSLLFIRPVAGAEVTVPESMDYCGMKLKITPEAQAYIQKVINNLKLNPDRFSLLTERADTWMPFVEETFASAGMPEDLKYIVILESALQGDAVSVSNAVGFWQFKDFTAKEVGLEVNDKIDERKHITRSSAGAATYFRRLNNEFDNWIYAITGYNQGPTGALAWIDKNYLGKDEMVIDMKVHVYALKAIGFKLAFQDVIGKNPNPRVWLEPVSTRGETSIEKLAEVSKVPKEKLLAYNLWISHSYLPDSRWFTYFVPHENVPKPSLLATSTEETPPVTINNHPEFREVEEWVDENPEVEIKTEYVSIPIDSYPGYGEKFICVKKNKTMMMTAIEAGMSVYKIYDLNGFDPTHIVVPGDVIYLEKEGKRQFHIAGKNESVSSIARKYHVSSQKLAELNHLSNARGNLYEGEVIYLKKKNPESKLPVILKKPHIPEMRKTKKLIRVEESVQGTVSQKQADPPKTENEKPQEYDTRMITHLVADKETLWSISKKYHTTVDLIKKLNDMNSDVIHTGMKLKVMERIPKP